MKTLFIILVSLVLAVMAEDEAVKEQQQQAQLEGAKEPVKFPLASLAFPAITYASQAAPSYYGFPSYPYFHPYYAGQQYKQQQAAYPYYGFSSGQQQQAAYPGQIYAYPYAAQQYQQYAYPAAYGGQQQQYPYYGYPAFGESSPAVGGYKPQEAGKEKQQPFPFGFPYGFPAGAPYFQYALKQQQQQQQQE